jgi:hypothetical protein
LLIPLAAGVLAAASLFVAVRAWRRCLSPANVTSRASALEATDELETRLLEKERNLELVLARRSIQAARRVALFGGTGLAFLSLTGGTKYDLWPAAQAFLLGFVAWGVCGELERRAGSAADAWREITNKKRKLEATRSGPD